MVFHRNVSVRKRLRLGMLRLMPSYFSSRSHATASPSEFSLRLYSHFRNRKAHEKTNNREVGLLQFPPMRDGTVEETLTVVQSNLDITIRVITISWDNSDIPSVPSDFGGTFNDIRFITIIVKFYGPKVRIYDRYRYIYADLYPLMPAYEYHMI
jgi:hypothetical protein